MTDQLHQDCIAAKAFEMAAQWFDKLGCTCPPNRNGQVPDHTVSCATHLAFCMRQLAPASARRQLQLDLINRAIEEAEWWQKLTGLDILSECDIQECPSCARMTSLKSQRTQLESEIAALEAQQARETP